jgi:hypothetical protein
MSVLPPKLFRAKGAQMTAARFNAANGSELTETARNLLDSHLTELDVGR